MPKPDHSTAPNHVRIGRIVGAFGIKGQLKVDPLSDFPERFERGRTVFLGEQAVTIEDCVWHKGRPVLKLSGIETRTAAEALQWGYIDASAAETPRLGDDEFFTRDLLDLDVFAEDGQRLGKVDDVLTTPAHDVLQVGALLIPVVKAFVLSVDLPQRRITVRLLPGQAESESEAPDR
ncbi:MAG: 16S rRNA processing protein RimM [Fimbriimonas ginsengisoli]|uniref:Ribosome maturation factor RimM n=1 Tax=Fimbriimonas ginsengisoli TaxID=1005039 RepID=A0A931LWN9_FIMGI|nr:16S rRNA processing protein RimM [Fimbriimonas ginsengisoli]MBI3721156.1 16S rRNA processing protein RimM [Fimbriimonas ginsengisoli]